MNDIVVVIPAYNPSNNLVKLVLELLNNKIKKIIIVNDGSLDNKVFLELKKYPECIVLEYLNNKGKGYAIKYAINYYLLNLKDKYLGILTMDADYQHLPNDAINLIDVFVKNQDSLVLGSRNFDLENVPKANRIGNKITSFIFKTLYKNKINDTQTGFRAIPNRFLNLCLEVSGNRYEYEMNMLIKFSNKNINIIEVPIKTVYYEENESKFNKVIDSIRIYKILFTEYIKFTLSSLISSFIDIILFMLLIKLFSFQSDNFKIIFSTFLARFVSSSINYNINKKIVFKSHEKDNIILFKFYFLCIIKMILSALLVLIFYNLLNINETLIKIIIDILLYIISYKIQKKYIFKT